MKTIFKLLSALFLCAFCVSLGVYAGENIYKDRVELSEQRYEDVQTIAVVNLDEGVDVNGEKVYYSNDLINFPNERFIRSSFEEAKRGIDNGAFAAYILIPATFSKSVESINTLPIQAEINYAINTNLSNEARVVVIDDINSYMTSINNSLSYVYLSSIMEEFHDVQDASKVILKNDEDDLNNILAISPSSLFNEISLEDIKRMEYKPDKLDFNDYYANNQSVIDGLNHKYSELNDSMKERYNELVDTSKNVSDSYSQTVQTIENFNPLIGADGKPVYEAGLDKLDKETSYLQSENMRKILDDIEEDTLISEGYYREQLQKYVNEQLMIIIAKQQKRYEEYVSDVSGNDTVSGNDPAPVEPFIFCEGMFSQAQISEVDLSVLPDTAGEMKIDLYSYTPDMNNIATDHPELFVEDPSDEEKISMNNSKNALKSNLGLSEASQQKLEKLIPKGTEIREIIQNDILQVTKDNLISGLEGIDKQLEMNTSSMQEQQDKMAKFDSDKEIDKYAPTEDLNRIKGNMTELQDIITEKTEKDTALVNEIYEDTEQNIRTYREKISTANTDTRENIIEAVDLLKMARSQINENNKVVLGSFSERLPYTRLGTLENEQAYDFIVEPVSFTDVSMNQKKIIDVEDDDFSLLLAMMITGIGSVLLAGVTIAVTFIQKKKAVTE